jgi:hypothetical protein
LFPYSYLYEDALEKNTSSGYKKDGLSLMLFNCEVAKPTLDGDMIQKFMEKYNQVRHLEGNVGWNLVD